MPVHFAPPDRRWVELAVVLDAPPHDVWRAVATAAGYRAWFTETTLEEHVGGALRFDFGGGASSGEVTAWDPPHRFGYVEREWLEGAPPVATEIEVVPRSDRRCLLRMRHVIEAPSDAWDVHLESFEAGWPGFFAVLRLYLAHFPGQAAAVCPTTVTLDSDPSAEWRRLTRALGLAGADVGDRVTAEDTPEPLSGVVERIQQEVALRSILVRLDAPGPGIAAVGLCRAGEAWMAALTLYRYGEGAAERVEATRAAWQQWLVARMRG